MTYKVISAKLIDKDIIVTLDKPLASINHNFEKRQHVSSKTWIYRAQAGDVVQYYSYDGPSKGFGGRIFAIHLTGGSHEMLIGPWSTRASVVNHVFMDRDPCIECKTDDNVWTSITIDALTRFGFLFDMELDKGELRFSPVEVVESTTPS